jgi:predicted membrane-bound dolichyl-phosphate-mannose-protein mannosyltransferase
MNSIYSINKSINKSIEFHGLKAQYIWYFGMLISGLLLLFAALYISGAGTLFSLSVTGSLAALGSVRIYRLSSQYGEFGLMKALAKKRLPKVLKSYGRRYFQGLAGTAMPPGDLSKRKEIRP